ncbi:MAG: PadR family transcriptional regulator [Anaerolineae bacterium]|nr:PadR family transcriptional regulator [Anaerolineae bacterium]
MSIRYAILGMLSWKPMTGYDLKQYFRDSLTMYWSGSSNQIYTTLVELHKEGLVTRETEDQETGPSRKVYTITTGGEEALRAWLLTAPELPEVKHPFLIQIAWADALTLGELDRLLARYEEELVIKLRMLREQIQRLTSAMQSPNRTLRERLLWDRINANWMMLYEGQLAWVQALRADLTLAAGEN